MTENLEQQLRVAFAQKAAAISSESSARLRASDYHPRRHAIPSGRSVGAGLAVAVSLVIGIGLLLLLHSGARSKSTAATPTSPSVTQPVGTPAVLAEIHRQAGSLVGSDTAFTAELHALHGYPVIVIAWASWCQPCQQQSALLQAASRRYGNKVAFIGADTSDTAGKTFLANHALNYPSYQLTVKQLSSITPIHGIPITIFIDPAGNVVHVQAGKYLTHGTLSADIAQYALGAL